MNSRLSRCCKARRSNIGFPLAVTTKVKAHKYFLFTEKFPSNENKEQLVDFIVTLINVIIELRVRRSLVNV